MANKVPPPIKTSTGIKNSCSLSITERRSSITASLFSNSSLVWINSDSKSSNWFTLFHFYESLNKYKNEEIKYFYIHYEI